MIFASPQDIIFQEDAEFYIEAARQDYVPAPGYITQINPWGVDVTVPYGETTSTTFLTIEQAQQLASACAFFLATGSISTTIAGSVTVVGAGADGVNIGVTLPDESVYTILLTPTQTQQLAKTLGQYVVTYGTSGPYGANV